MQTGSADLLAASLKDAAFVAAGVANYVDKLDELSTVVGTDGSKLRSSDIAHIEFLCDIVGIPRGEVQKSTVDAFTNTLRCM